MKTYDAIAGVLVDALLDGKKVLFRPCATVDKEERISCRCGSTLEYAYMENRLYAIRCTRCKTVALVRKRNPVEAADAFGYRCQFRAEEECAHENA